MKNTKQKYLILIVTLSAVFSCAKDTTNDVKLTGSNLGLKLLWNYPLSNQNVATSFVAVGNTITHDNGVLIGDAEDGKQMLKLIDIDTKATIWKWTDSKSNIFRLRIPYQNANTLVQQVGYQLYGINLEDGTSRFNITTPLIFSPWVRGIGNTFFVAGGKDEEKLYIGDTRTGQLSNSITPEYQRKFPVGSYERSIDPPTIIPILNDTLIIIPYTEPADTGVSVNLGTYSLVQKKWLYTKQLRERGFYNTMPHGVKVYNGKIYATTSNHLICLDLATGKEIWRNSSFTHAFAFAIGGIAIYANRLIANAEDGNLYAIDPETGKIQWFLSGVGGPKGFVEYYKGSLYLIGSGSGTFYVVDIDNGNIQVKSKAPSDGDGIFQPRVVVIPPKESNQKGKVMLSTYKNLYMYETLN